MINPNEQAFPFQGYKVANDLLIQPQTGLSKREYFACAAMNGILQAATFNPQNNTTYFVVAKDCASKSVEYADALIAELSKNPSPDGRPDPLPVSGAV